MWSYSFDYLISYSWNNKFRNSDDDYQEDVAQLNDLGLNVNSGYIWLASRYVTSYSTNTAFCVRYFGDVDIEVVESGLSDVLFNVYSDGEGGDEAPSRGFRPVFLLSSSAKVSEGDGSKEHPYIIK